MNILTLNYEYPPVGGGAAPITAQLAEHLVQCGHTVDVVTMRYNNLPHRETINGVEIYRIPSWRTRPDICRTHEMATYLLGARKPTLALAKRRSYDVIHAHFIIPTSPLAWYIRRHTGTPYVITCHGSDVPNYNPDRFKILHDILQPIWKRLVRTADVLVSPSQALQSLILSHCPDLNITVIPNGYQPLIFDATLPRQNTILLCSRLLPRKGLQYVIEAVKDLSLDWQVHIIGDGPYKSALQALAENSRIPIHFYGWLDRESTAFKALFETASVFVLPSEMENFPTVLLEAMSAGIPIITSSAGGCAEVVGRAGLLVPPKNADALREKILYLIENKTVRAALAENGQQQVERFLWPKIARQYTEMYQRLSKKP